MDVVLAERLEEIEGVLRAAKGARGEVERRALLAKGQALGREAVARNGGMLSVPPSVEALAAYRPHEPGFWRSQAS